MDWEAAYIVLHLEVHIVNNVILPHFIHVIC